MRFKRYERNCFDSHGNIINEDLYVKKDKTENFLKLSESFFVNCLMELGAKNEKVLAFIINNTNHNTNEVNFTEDEITSFLAENPIADNPENSIIISRRKAHEAIKTLISNDIIKLTSDGRFVLNPKYINCTRKSTDELYIKYLKKNATAKSVKKLKTISREIKSIGSLERKENKKTVFSDYNYIRVKMNELADNDFFKSKKVWLFLNILKMAEEDDRSFEATYEMLMNTYSVKKDLLGTVMKYLLEKEYIRKKFKGKYLFNPAFISKSYPSLRIKNLQNYNNTVENRSLKQIAEQLEKTGF